MNSKDKGNIAETLALAKLTELGIQVSIPYGDNARYDLIADLNGKLVKIQVKYCDAEISVNDSISCPCRSSLNHTTNKIYTTYENDVDYFIFYIACTKELLWVPISKIGNHKSITFRWTKPVNNQANVNLIKDFLLETSLCVETLHDVS